MKILSLDLASKTGWSVTTKDGLQSCGVWYLSKSDKSRFYQLTIELEHMMQQEAPIDLAAYEVPGRLFGHARRIIPGLQAVVEVWCDRWSVPFVTITPSALKKHATTKGRADKLQMTRMAEKKWRSFTFETDDVADAAWIGDYFMKDHLDGT